VFDLENAAASGMGGRYERDLPVPMPVKLLEPPFQT
jgi:hypothetical protein